MKHIMTIFAAALLLPTLTVAAQTRWGIEAGANISHAFETTETKAGFNIGVIGEYSFNNHWFADASLKLSSQPSGDEYSWSFNNDATTYHSKIDFTPYYLTLPVRAGYRFAVNNNFNLSVSAGPMIGIGLFGKGKFHSAPINSKDNQTEPERYKSTDIFNKNSDVCFSSSRFEYGFNCRIGIELSKHYTAGVEYSLMHIAGDITSVDNMGIFGFSIGYKF